jgi:hypothetical protein
MVTFGNDYIGVWRNGERKNTLSFVHSIFSHKIERLSPLEIDQINKMWNQKDIHGVADMCENKTSCSFDVTNANVGSSCGTNGVGGLYITYHCISK